MPIQSNYLVETALLTHGLASLDNQALAAAWGDCPAQLAWLDEGEIITGTMAAYLPFRLRQRELLRIDYFSLAQAQAQRRSGALTASGTLAVCAQLSCMAAVSAGLGGICAGRREKRCADLVALAELPVALIASAPKDMADAAQTFAWLRAHGVRVYGKEQPYDDGFLFRSSRTALDGIYGGQPLQGQTLLLNPLPERLRDTAILTRAIAAGQMAEQAGHYYHPAATAEIDRLSHGCSATWQLNALRANIAWAEQLLPRAAVQATGRDRN